MGMVKKMEKGNGLWNGLVNYLGNWWGKEKTNFFFKFLFWMGEEMVEGMGKGMDWGIKKVILKSEYWFF